MKRVLDYCVGLAKRQKLNAEADDEHIAAGISIEDIPGEIIEEIIRQCFNDGHWELSIANKFVYAIAKKYLPYPFIGSKYDDLPHKQFWSDDKSVEGSYEDEVAKNLMYSRDRLKILENEYLRKKWLVYYLLCEIKAAGKLWWNNHIGEYEVIEYVLFTPKPDKNKTNSLVYYSMIFDVLSIYRERPLSEFVENAALHDHHQLVELFFNFDTFKGIDPKLAHIVFKLARRKGFGMTETAILQTGKVDVLKLIDECP